jgi:hypothetical protein
MPAPPTVDRLADDIMLGIDTAGRLKRSAKHLAAGAELASFGARLITAALRHQTLPRWDIGGTRSVKPDLRVREQVILDPVAQEPLAVGEADIFEVWLDYAESGPDPGTPGAETIAVFRGEQRVGLLGPQADRAYRDAVREACDAGLVPVIVATRSQADDSSWQLSLGLPAPGQLRFHAQS